ncbi:hypothetical protein [Thalassospira marina]|uniref:Transmembrane protein n=1 Tax=Thalassospira marina TaxID=2048283 RepID=A0A2N3KMS2_9PROT|nr:hypothetical protein [Thalassospira marina]PKR51852.1 hypothetical protein COO20_18615 [Thalassospira marina]
MSKVVNEERDTVFVDRFWSGRKLVCGFVFVFMWCLVFYDIHDAIKVTNQNFYERGGSHLTGWDRRKKFLGYFGYGYVWGDNLYWKGTYEINCLKYGEYGCDSRTSPVEFMKITLKKDYVDVLKYFASFCFVLFCFVLFLLTLYPLMRKPRYVVFNKSVGAIYTWHRGFLWILPASDFSYKFREEVNFMFGKTGNGFMQMSLQSAKKPKKKKKFKMGVFPYPCEKYGVRLAEALEIYLHCKDMDTSYIPPATSYRSWERSILGRKKLPDDIHDQAAAWMRKYGEKAS